MMGREYKEPVAAYIKFVEQQLKANPELARFTFCRAGVEEVLRYLKERTLPDDFPSSLFSEKVHSEVFKTRGTVNYNTIRATLAAVVAVLKASHIKAVRKNGYEFSYFTRIDNKTVTAWHENREDIDKLRASILGAGDGYLLVTEVTASTRLVPEL